MTNDLRFLTRAVKNISHKMCKIVVAYWISKVHLNKQSQGTFLNKFIFKTKCH